MFLPGRFSEGPVLSASFLLSCLQSDREIKSEKSAGGEQREGPPNALGDLLTQMPTSQLGAFVCKVLKLSLRF